ncbi:hypothetical protein [uncultured Algibacter sp.]|uniref:hypothetical protein n=1 Tax=uncultured Algibacter sp. TaxID=298659 RepID=UPI0030EE3C12|tara:strand:- start:141 stop:1355 length:1215 start_codon:yes stop_codon:yes gene_type:complete
MRTAEAGGYRKVRIEGYVRLLPDSPNTGELAPLNEFNDFVLTNAPNSTQEEINERNRVINKMQGIKGFDPLSNFISSIPAEKTVGEESINIFEYSNNWFPIDGKKHVCCGKLKKFQTYNGSGAEMDWNIFIEPNDEFSFLIDDVLKYKDPEWATKAWNGEWRSGGWHINKETGGYLLEGELTPDKSFYDNLFFPNSGEKVENIWGHVVTKPNIVLLEKEICLYGPWVRERVHNNRPEIHPSEMIWWREGKGYYIMLLQDDSNRFDNNADFGFLGGSAPSNWKPWTEPPLTAQFKIAFKVNPSESGLPQEMDIREVYNRFVVTKEDTDASADSDNGTSHALVINNKNLLVVNEQQKNDNDLGVKSVDVSKRPDGTIQGYLQITTIVGGPDLAGDEGYHVLYIQKK